MRKIIVYILVLAILCSVVFAQALVAENRRATAQIRQTQTAQETRNTAEEVNLTIQQRQQIKEQLRNDSRLLIQQGQQLRAQTTAELREIIQKRKQELENETRTLIKIKQKVYQNQNRVRLAVHSLLAMENRTGGIGRNISQIAREFNNSLRATINAEERIQKRSRLVKFFIGGDKKSAEEIEQAVNESQERIRKLKQLREECDCEEEIKAMLQEQIQNMEQEQTRLRNLAQAEKKIKGLFRWLRRRSD